MITKLLSLLLDRIYGAVVLLAAWLVVFLEPDIEPEPGEPYRCDGGEEPLPYQDSDTPLMKAIMRDEWINGVELWLGMQKGRKG